MSADFDIIFAGGGTAACVIAGRLTAANPSLKILIVEGGQHSRDLPIHVQPCRYVEHLAPNSTTVTSHVGKPNAGLGGRATAVQCGRAIGGGSVVNFMFYVRGAASDYDDWEAFGNKGWSFDELLPLIKKFESFAPIPDRPTHGYSGPIGVSSSGVELGLGKQLLKVAREYDPGRPQADDIHDFKTGNAYGPSYSYINSLTGKRSDAASRYLYPHSENPNLKIIVGKRVKRVVLENGRAVGIEYTSDANSPEGASDELVTVKASKLVVLTAGAFGSPSILERSGIGAPSILEKNDIRVLVDLPGVGENYQDHLGIPLAFRASEDTETLDDVWTDPEAVSARLNEWEGSGRGKIAHNGAEALVKVRPTAAQLSEAGPALETRWKTFFQHSPDKPMGIIVPFSGLHLHPPTLVDQKFITGIYYILYPESIGSVHIASGKDANAPLDFDPDFLSSAADLAQLALLYKLTRELARRLPGYRGESASHHPVFPPGSPAGCRERDEPVPADAPDISYSDADNEAIAKYHRDGVFATWHSLGTCAMKPREQGGVVDARLNVYGVEGLKVADMSICPSNVGNNTYSTALLIGEKAATIIAEDLGVNI